MPEKEIQNANEHAEWIVKYLPFFLAVGLSCLGGIVSYLNRIDKQGLAFSFFRLSVEIVTSGFVGIVSFMLCDAAGLGWSTTAAIVAISGHMGTRALFLIEGASINFFNNFVERNTNGNRKTKTRTTEKTRDDA